MTLDEELLAKAVREARGRIPDTEPEQPEHVFSELFEQKMQRLILEQKKPSWRKQLTRWSRRAAVIVVAGFVGLSACVLSVDAWRVKLFEMVEQKHPEYSDIRYEPIAGADTDVAKFQNFELVEYRPAYLPSGYRLTNQMLGHGINWSDYTNAGDGSFSFQQSILGSTGSAINTEGSELTPFDLNGNEAFKMSNRGAQFVLWSDEQYEYMIVANDTDISLEDAVKIAQSVTVTPPGAYHPPHLELSLNDRPINYLPEDAVINGDVVIKDKEIKNPAVLDDFLADVKAGTPSVICVADFDQPILLTHEIYFDGFGIRCVTDETRVKGDETNHISSSSDFDTIARQTEDGEVALQLKNRGGTEKTLLRYKEPVTDVTG